ncbi:MAG TPA: alpha/beta fold hydrolase [Caulobacteraceae bacterium]|nr:alpha/beta fold hydrolase [Caulobacteraceae bacterium]
MTQASTTADNVPFVRTPDANFEGLADFSFPANYLAFEGLRLHFVDVGPADGPVALLTHGMPTWSFLYRHIIASLCAAGWRCIAADHIGFGRSDKVTDEGWYSIGRHVASHRALVEALDLRDTTLFCQDWGGPIGLAQVAEAPERFSRLVIMNTWLHHAGYEYTPALRQWNAQWQPGGLFEVNIPDPLSIGWFMMLATGRMAPSDLFGIIGERRYPELDSEAAAARRGYDAPFEGVCVEACAGPRRFPLSLPFYDPARGAADDQARWHEALSRWRKPVHFIWGGQDAVFTEAWGRKWASEFPQATFDLLPLARHFLQETHGREIAEIFLRRVAEERQ